MPIQQILVINSLEDQRFVPFLEKVFATIGVGTVWDDYEDIGHKISRDDFQRTVEASSAIFLVLSLGAQASFKDGDLDFLNSHFAKNKDVFVFEHCEDIDRISLKVPRVTQYFSLYITNTWTVEVAASAAAFEVVTRTSIALPEVKLERLRPDDLKIYFSAATGRALFDLSTTKPVAKKAVCPHCAAAYIVHIPEVIRVLRCPVCGQFCEMKVPVTAGAPPIDPGAS
jgi:hypothetical protein